MLGRLLRPGKREGPGGDWFSSAAPLSLPLPPLPPGPGEAEPPAGDAPLEVTFAGAPDPDDAGGAAGAAGEAVAGDVPGAPGPAKGGGAVSGPLVVGAPAGGGAVAGSDADLPLAVLLWAALVPAISGRAVWAALGTGATNASASVKVATATNARSP